MQGVIQAYDPGSGEGLVIADTDRSVYPLAPDALERSIFRWLRQGQRVVFEVDPEGRATSVRSGAEVDLGLPEA